VSDFDYTADIAWDYHGQRHVIHVRWRPHRNGRFYRRLTVAPLPGDSFEQACDRIVPAVAAEYRRVTSK